MASDLISNSKNGFLILQNDQNHMLHGYIWVKNKKDIKDLVKRRAAAAILDFFNWL